jgi:hypothetical protein
VAPFALVLDTSDPVAGPALLIADHSRVRCVHMRTRMVTTIAGVWRDGTHVDGPGGRAQWRAVCGRIAKGRASYQPCQMAGNGDGDGRDGRRGGGGGPGGPMVTTLIGRANTLAAPGAVQFSASSAECFQQPIKPLAMALHVPSSANIEDERDVGRLFVGCEDGVHVFHLAEGKRQHFPLSIGACNGLAVNEDGARLFVVSNGWVAAMDTQSGASTVLVNPPPSPKNSVSQQQQQQPQSGVVLSCHSRGCVIDRATRSLVMYDIVTRQIVRLRGVGVDM